ncbi:MAG TPA: DoxX family protein [Candidatus Elarobacter sp.]
MPITTNPARRNADDAKIGALLWTIQIALALLFLFGGGVKLAMPVDVLSRAIPLPWQFMKFIGVAEVAGALGLVLPGLLRLPRLLTPLAAGGLVIIMIGATTVTIVAGEGFGAAFPAVVGLLAAFIAYRHRRLAERRSIAAAVPA